MLLKVFDASSDNIHEHIETVENVLKNMDMHNKTNLVVMNKIDTISDPDILKGLKARFIDANFISAYKNTGIKTFINNIEAAITSEFCHDIFHLTYKQTKILDYIYNLTKVLNKKSDYEGIKLEVEGSRESLNKIKQLIEK